MTKEIRDAELVSAIENEDLLVFEDLLKKNEYRNINKIICSDDTAEYSPLMYVCKEGKLGVAEFLLGIKDVDGKRMADVDQVTKRGSDSLSIAVREGHVNIVKLFISIKQESLKRGAIFLDIDRQRNDGHNPLTLASENGHTEIVGLLLDAGARTDLKLDDEGPDETAFYIAATIGRPDVVKLFLEKKKSGRIELNIDEQRKDGYSALMGASHGGNTEIIGLLLDAGARTDLKLRDPNNPDNPRYINNATAFYIAVEEGEIDAVKLFLERKKSGRIELNIDERVNNGSTPLKLALSRNCEILEMLIDAGADRRGLNTSLDYWSSDPDQIWRTKNFAKVYQNSTQAQSQDFNVDEAITRLSKADIDINPYRDSALSSDSLKWYGANQKTFRMLYDYHKIVNQLQESNPNFPDQDEIGGVGQFFDLIISCYKPSAADVEFKEGFKKRFGGKETLLEAEEDLIKYKREKLVKEFGDDPSVVDTKISKFTEELRDHLRIKENSKFDDYDFVAIDDEDFERLRIINMNKIHSIKKKELEELLEDPVRMALSGETEVNLLIEEFAKFLWHDSEATDPIYISPTHEASFGEMVINHHLGKQWQRMMLPLLKEASKVLAEEVVRNQLAEKIPAADDQIPKLSGVKRGHAGDEENDGENKKPSGLVAVSEASQPSSSSGLQMSF